MNLKKILLGISALSFSNIALAGNITIDETLLGNTKATGTNAMSQAGPNVGQSQIMVELAVSPQFEVAVFNDKLPSASARTGVSGTSSIDLPTSATYQSIDLGYITGGILSATSCSDLKGLNTSLGVTPSLIQDADFDSITLGMVQARTSDCGVDSSNGKQLEVRIPLEILGSKTGSSALQVSWAIDQVAGKEFDMIAVCGSDTVGKSPMVGSWTGSSSLCGGAPLAYAMGATSSTTTGVQTSPTVLVASSSSSGELSHTVEVQASLSGSAAKSEYQAVLTLTAGLNP